MLKLQTPKETRKSAPKRMTVMWLTISLTLLLTTASAVEVDQKILDGKNKTIAAQQFELNLKDAQIIVLQGQADTQKELAGEYRTQLFWRNCIEAGVIVCVILAVI
jgi:hypothetical protein